LWGKNFGKDKHKPTLGIKTSRSINQVEVCLAGLSHKGRNPFEGRKDKGNGGGHIYVKGGWDSSKRRPLATYQADSCINVTRKGWRKQQIPGEIQGWTAMGGKEKEKSA